MQHGIKRKCLRTLSILMTGVMTVNAGISVYAGETEKGILIEADTLEEMPLSEQQVPPVEEATPSETIVVPSEEMPPSETIVVPSEEMPPSEPIVTPSEETPPSQPTVVPSEGASSSETTVTPSEETSSPGSTVAPSEEIPPSEPTVTPPEETPSSEPTVTPPEEVPSSEPTADPTGEKPVPDPTVGPTGETPVPEPTVTTPEEKPPAFETELSVHSTLGECSLEIDDESLAFAKALFTEEEAALGGRGSVALYVNSLQELLLEEEMKPEAQQLTKEERSELEREQEALQQWMEQNGYEEKASFVLRLKKGLESESLTRVYQTESSLKLRLGIGGETSGTEGWVLLGVIGGQTVICGSADDFSEKITFPCSIFGTYAVAYKSETPEAEEPVMPGEENPPEVEEPVTPGEENPPEGEEPVMPGEEKPPEVEEPVMPGEENPSEVEVPVTPGEENPPKTEESVTSGEDNSSEGEESVMPGEENPSEVEEPVTPGEENPPEGEEPVTPGEENPPEVEEPVLPGEENPPEVQEDPKPKITMEITGGEVIYYPGSQGIWNPAIHAYEGASSGWWSCQEKGQEIVVKNNGAQNVSLILAYVPAQSYEQITGFFTDSQGSPMEELTLSAESSAVVYLHLLGEPSGSMNNATIGSVAYTLREEV